MIVRKSITIINSSGKKQYGILSFPSSQSMQNDSVGFIIFCQAGLALKSGVGNQFRLMCDKLSEKYYVLRFDQSGTGDSQGFIANNIPINDFFLKIMGGECVEDTISVLEWVKERFPDQKIILMGQCGGCLTAAYTSLKYIDSIYALIFIAPPVLFLPKYSNHNDQIRSYDSVKMLKMYFRKAFSAKQYIRLFTGKSDFKLIYQSVVTSLIGQLKAVPFLNHSKFISRSHKRFNEQFYISFQNAIKKRKPILFIFPELDNETYDFKEYFFPMISTSIKLKLTTIKYLRKSDHSLMFKQGRYELDKILDEWIDGIFKN